MKKVLSLALVSLIGIGTLSGFTPKQTIQAKAASKITLNTVSMFGGTDPNAVTYQSYIKKFMAKYPNVTVQDASATSDDNWKAQVINDFASGSEGDVVFYFTGADAAKIVSSGEVVDIATIRKSYPKYASNIKSTVMSQMKESNGKTYAVPVKGYWEGIFCNQDLFTKYKLKLPTTWSNFTTAIKTFRKNNIVPIAASLGDIPHYMIEHLVLSVGGITAHHVNPGTNMSKVPASWTTALGLFKTLGSMKAFPSNTASSKDAEIQQLFINKKAAMRVDGSWFAGSVKSQNTTTVVPFPAYNSKGKDPTDIISGFSSGFYITKKAWKDPAKRAAAVNFVETLTSTAAITDFVNAAGGTPATAIKSNSKSTLLTKAAVKMGSDAKNIDTAMDSRLSKDCYSVFIGDAASLAAGKISPADVLKAAIAKNK